MTHAQHLTTRIRQRLSQRGFTLIELLLTLAVAGTLATIAVPNVQQIVQNSRLSDNANDMVTSLTRARIVALTERVRVVACPSDDSVSCNNTLSWGDGWIMFVDCNEDGNLDADSAVCTNATNERMLNEGFAPDGASLDVADNQTLRFEPDGRVLASRTFTMCADDVNEARYITVNMVGRSRVTRIYADESC